VRRKRYTVPVHLRLSPEAAEWLRDAAAAERLTESEYLRAMVEAAMARVAAEVAAVGKVRGI
jgi:uncharacterized protein (DUF1778 family)